MAFISEIREYTIEFNEVQNAIKDGACAALVNKNIPSVKDSRPRFLTNDRQKEQKVLIEIEDELRKCSSFCFSVAFVTLGAVTSLLETLSELEQRNIPGKILATDYLSFSDPKALEKLASFSNIEVRMFKTADDAEVGFHTKGYLFERPNGTKNAIIGSSNLTQAALSENKEWNIRLASTEGGELVGDLFDEFYDLWSYSVSLDSYIDTYRKLYEEKKEYLGNFKVNSLEAVKLKPNSMQISFIERLDRLVEEGAKRALLISATGTGKTYASAFAVRHLHPKKVLFLVHREQIARDAKQSYMRVFDNKINAGIVSGTSKDFDADFIFSTVQTMSKDHVLHRFDPNYFDVIVVDEVHRAGAGTYTKILDYFKPGFCLGMSATPERSDDFDIYQLFDNNIAYEIRLQQALEEKLLCPFHYFGISDIEINGEKICEESAFNMLIDDTRLDYIIQKAELFGHSGDRVKGLVFCSSVKEAQELSDKLNTRGYRTMALSGSDSQELRQDAVKRLVCNKDSDCYEDRLDYILTVDIFNEGIDIPDVNQVIMLRPTQSAIVFVQQLGRGLRKAKNKDFVVVIDFIGNYKNSYLIPLALTGDRTYGKDSARMDLLEGGRKIPGCSTIHFDEVARKQIFESIDNSQTGLRFITARYKELRNKLGRVPAMVDFVEFGEIDPMLFCERKKSYYRFLQQKEDAWDRPLTEREQEFIESLSLWIGEGMRPHELCILQMILKGDKVSFNTLKDRLKEYDVVLDEKGFASSYRVLKGIFFRNNYHISCVDQVDGELMATEEFLGLLGSDNFVYALNDLIDHGFIRYKKKYIGDNHGFKRYETYKRRDICRLLNWKKDMQGGMIGGYPQFAGENECPIFVTYDKGRDVDDPLDYKDKFVNQSTFAWQSAHNDGVDSKKVSRILNSSKTGMRLLLFVKKSDAANKCEFYYMGDVVPIKYSEGKARGINGYEKITNVLFQLDKPVNDGIYDFIAS